MIVQLSYHQAKVTLRDALADLVSPNPAGPIRDIHKGHFSLYGAAAYPALSIFFAGTEENPESSNEVRLPGSFTFGVAGIAQKISSTFQGSGEEEAEELASLAFSAWVDALMQMPDLGVSGVVGATVLSTRASDADEYGNEFQDANQGLLWVEGGTVRIDLI